MHCRWQVEGGEVMQGLKEQYCSTGVSDASKEWNALRQSILQELYQVRQLTVY